MQYHFLLLEGDQIVDEKNEGKSSNFTISEDKRLRLEPYEDKRGQSLHQQQYLLSNTGNHKTFKGKLHNQIAEVIV